MTGITLGAAVGAVLGLTGAGGGILAVPALMIGMGYSLTDARPISLDRAGRRSVRAAWHMVRAMAAAAVSNVSMHSGVATSLMVIATVSAVSTAEMFAGGAGMATQGWWFAGAAAVGTLTGRGLSSRIAPRPLQCAFAGVMLLAAGMLMVKLFP